MQQAAETLKVTWAAPAATLTDQATFYAWMKQQPTRENYIVSSKRTGIKHNRKRVLVVRTDVIAMGLFKDVIDE